VAPSCFISASVSVATRMLSRSAMVASIMKSRTTPRRLPASDVLLIPIGDGLHAVCYSRHFVARIGASGNFFAVSSAILKVGASDLGCRRRQGLPLRLR
jgi:hypothetical protein